MSSIEYLSSIEYFTLRVKRGHFYHILMSKTHESNVFTPYSRCVHSGVSFGLGTVGARFACERVMADISELEPCRKHAKFR